MHYSRTLTVLFAGLSLASPAPSPVSLLKSDANIEPSVKLPDHTAHIDLINFEESVDGLSERSLEKRRVFDICAGSSTRAGGYFTAAAQDQNAHASSIGVCVGIGSGISGIIFGIAGLMKASSDRKDCSEHSGSIDGVTWKVYATGRNCDTTAQIDTIRGAISNYLQSVNESVCGVHCLKMSHGGTYNGFVTLAPAGTPLDGFYCGQSMSFGDCVSGGERDV